MKNLKTLTLVVSSFALSYSSFAQWKNTSEVSILNAGGNTDVSVYNLKSETSVELGKHKLSLGGHYTLGEADSTVDARNWDIHVQDRFSLSNKWGVFLGEKVEGDRFKGFITRYNTDIGGAYKLYNTDDFKANIELGFRYVVEEKTTQAYAHDNQIRLYGDLDHKLNPTVSWKFYSEFLKDIEQGDAWELNFGPSLVASLSSTFSLKVGYEGEYRNLPAISGAKKFDYKYTTGLIANF
tara:strand:- start:3249 stop:3962 length:714 start_codon:yes stop_codon:yes gene_type:complete